MDQIKQKIEQAKMDKTIAELQRRDTSDIERKIEALTKQQDALNRRTHGNITAASNASRTPQYPRPFLPGKGQWVTPSSTGPVKIDCSAQIKEIERLQRLLKNAIEQLESRAVGGKKSRSKKTRSKKSRSKKSRSKKSKRKKSKRKKSRSKKSKRKK
jgi:hypothetical protein